MSSGVSTAAIAIDSDKRRQIIDGARAVFMAQGFDAASMGEIARQAGVSKGTLYVYFDSKEALFQAIVHEQCQVQAEQVFTLDAEDHDVKSVLTRLGKSFVGFLCRPERVSPLRTIISISERMPAAGQQFYETGPATGIARVARYLEAQVSAGVLEMEDTEVAAAQFLESCSATLLKPILFGLADAPDQSRIDHVVGIAVRTFLAAYLKR
ncbi:MAG TPA: TetR/AcrR family transcriptional regulator [Stellaceae bacterium]|jgi:AcrR family transcriptional regulator|nr:TetR/AcrR family transcriptional regulator [Stellaceae bacterium]